MALTLKANNGKLREIVTDAEVFLSSNISTFFKIPRKSHNVKALWDTGATNTAISSNLATILNLTPTGRATIHGISQSYETNTYVVDIGLPNKVMIEDVPVTEAPNLGEYDLLIGMDIITIGDMSITNGSRNTWFSFRYPPDIHQIDYVSKANEIMEKKVRKEKSKRKEKRRR